MRLCLPLFRAASRSVLAPLQLIHQGGRKALDDQGPCRFVIFDLIPQQVRFEADRQPLGTPGETAELVESALVRGDFRRQAVVLVADVVVERLGPVLVDQAGQLFKGYRLAQLGLGSGVLDQGLGFSRADSSGRSSLSTKSLKALSRVRVSPGPSTPSWQPMKSRK